MTKKVKIWIIIGVLFVAGLAIAGILYAAFPVAMTTYGGMSLNYLKTLSTPAGTVSTETNPAYKAPEAAAAATPPADAAWPNAAAGDWPSYNRTPTSQRFSPLTQINTKNVGQMKVLCTYSTGQLTSFETTLIMVEGSLIGTTEFDIFSSIPPPALKSGARALMAMAAYCPPIVGRPIWMACCFEARRMHACWPLISRPASNCGRR